MQTKVIQLGGYNLNQQLYTALQTMLETYKYTQGPDTLDFEEATRIIIERTIVGWSSTAGECLASLKSQSGLPEEVIPGILTALLEKNDKKIHFKDIFFYFRHDKRMLDDQKFLVPVIQELCLKEQTKYTPTKIIEALGLKNTSKILELMMTYFPENPEMAVQFIEDQSCEFIAAAFKLMRSEDEEEKKKIKNEISVVLAVFKDQIKANKIQEMILLPESANWPGFRLNPRDQLAQ